MGAVRWRIRAGVAALALALVACGTADRDVPPELVVGRDACLECGMIISELRFASGFVDSEGVSHGFDDLGCLANYVEAHSWTNSPPIIWVSDFNGRGWMHATNAWFVRVDSIVTPMGYGIVAARDSVEAARLSARGGVAFRYGTLLQRSMKKQSGAASGGAVKE